MERTIETLRSFQNFMRNMLEFNWGRSSSPSPSSTVAGPVANKAVATRNNESSDAGEEGECVADLDDFAFEVCDMPPTETETDSDKKKREEEEEEESVSSGWVLLDLEGDETRMFEVEDNDAEVKSLSSSSEDSMNGIPYVIPTLIQTRGAGGGEGEGADDNVAMSDGDDGSQSSHDSATLIDATSSAKDERVEDGGKTIEN
ncbi:hypothetical protein KEM54_001265 [Ascosphaera aggregata]|nr:hypothetical protein KEM54_001265 [Ascosphaera aggregata]